MMTERSGGGRDAAALSLVSCNCSNAVLCLGRLSTRLVLHKVFPLLIRITGVVVPLKALFGFL